MEKRNYKMGETYAAYLDCMTNLAIIRENLFDALEKEYGSDAYFIELDRQFDSLLNAVNNEARFLVENKCWRAHQDGSDSVSL